MGITHAMILVDIAALCLGVGVILVGLLSWERSGIRWLLDLAFLLGAATVLLMLDILRNYATVTGWPPGRVGRAVLAALSAAGNFGLVAAAPLFARRILPEPRTRPRLALAAAGMLLLPAVGALAEATGSVALEALDDVGLCALLAFTAVRLTIGHRTIAEPETRRMLHRMIWLTIGIVVIGPAQLAVMNLLPALRGHRRLRLAQLAYYLGMLAIVLIYAVKHLFRPVGTEDAAPSADFMMRYGISNRERDIIAMIEQGYANRAIGERLFISDRTVKNHISNIYRKTGAVNKVQLLNMVRNDPAAGSRKDPP